MANPLGKGGSWSLTFEDFFTTINTSVWSTHYINGDTHDDELGQYTSDQVQTAIDGLHLLATHEQAPDGRDYKTGMIASYPGLTIVPGQFLEASIKVSGGKGMWPAFWLLNADEYPPEIDIFEILNGDSVDHMHYHASNSNYDAYAQDFSYGESLANNFHTYGLYYDVGLIEWWFDGQKVGETSSDVTSDPLYITINNAVSASNGYAGAPDNTTVFPNSMVVRYVRTWKPSTIVNGLRLFTGVETFSWSLNDFKSFATFCKTNGVSQVVVKNYEITQGEWYSGIGGSDAVKKVFDEQSIDCLFYGFFYGTDPTTEINAINNQITKYGRYCLDLESDFDNNNKIDPFISGLQAGELWVSTWANVGTHGWISNIEKLDKLVSVWMPQAYSDSLVKDMYAQFPHVQGVIWPTFHIINTPYQDASPYQSFSLWEYELAKQDPASFQAYVLQQKGETVTTYPTNNRRMVFNALETSEFQPGHTEFACGAFSVAVIGRATNYNITNGNSAQNQINWAEAEYAKTAGDNGPSNTAGASVDDMHTYLRDAGLHWWDTDISPSTMQEHDIATIKAAIQHGYPVVATVTEQSVYDVDLGRNPYWWGPSGNHILVWCGIAADGNLLACDCANVVQGDGNLQTKKNVQSWPRKYAIDRIDNLWASVVKTSWLPNIPSGDPLSWPPYSQPTPPAVTDYVTQQAQDVWKQNSLGLDMSSGIAKAFLAGVVEKKLFMTYPVSHEFQTVNWSGDIITVQFFSNGTHAEHYSTTQITLFYNSSGQVIYQGKI